MSRPAFHPAPSPPTPPSPLAASFPGAVFVAVALLAGVPSPASAQAPGFDAAAEVRALMEHPSVQAAFRHIEENDPWTIATLRELTQIPAPPFMEEVRGQRFLELLQESGVDSVWADAEGNVIGLRRGNGTGTMIFSGHLDTVFPEGTDVTIRENGDTLFAPGIADDTRGLVAVLAVLRAMNAADIQTEQDIWFVGTVGEEGTGDLRGVKHLFREGSPDFSAFISIDGLGHSGVTNAGLGSHRYRVAFKGPGGHSWGAFGLGNPIHALGRAVAAFDAEAKRYTDNAAQRTSYNVGTVGGGTSVNSIPFEAWMEIDMRSESPEALLEIDAVFQAAMRRGLEEANAVRARGEELTLEITMIGNRPSGEIPEDHPFIQRALAATELMGGITSLRRSSTDSNTPISLGIPSVTIGGGGAGGNSHSLAEFFMNHNGPVGIQRALLILVSQAGMVPVM
ncbi:MAG: M20/M25/M40 family metallo-hydrolase [Gammaproteobacteria bacterium]|nr:M20/M25/M40 family metallo-hydrolase [Gammaproteobacteria bacterium]